MGPVQEMNNSTKSYSTSSKGVKHPKPSGKGDARDAWEAIVGEDITQEEIVTTRGCYSKKRTSEGYIDLRETQPKFEAGYSMCSRP